jgi:hypothetical protein
VRRDDLVSCGRKRRDGMAGMTYLLSLTLVRMDRSWLPLHDENTRSNLPG